MEGLRVTSRLVVCHVARVLPVGVLYGAGLMLYMPPDRTRDLVLLPLLIASTSTLLLLNRHAFSQKVVATVKALILLAIPSFVAIANRNETVSFVDALGYAVRLYVAIVATAGAVFVATVTLPPRTHDSNTALRALEEDVGIQEQPEQLEKPEKPEKPEQPGKLEQPEKPEQPDADDRTSCVTEDMPSFSEVCETLSDIGSVAVKYMPGPKSHCSAESETGEQLILLSTSYPIKPTLVLNVAQYAAAVNRTERYRPGDSRDPEHSSTRTDPGLP